MSGWFKQQRSLVEQPWFKDAEAVQLYAFVKCQAYVQDGVYEGQIIRRGSCPTTRAEMMEATGMKYMRVDKSLKVLIAYGAITVKANNKFTIVTICDYDSLDVNQGLFSAYSQQQDNSCGDNRATAAEIAGETAGETTPNISNKKKEERNKDILISPYSPYKRERETRDVVLEIKKRYNKIFDGKLPPLLRLHEPTRRMVETCVGRFGLGNVDRVFSQVLREPFSLGVNKTGFVASFQFIFTPSNFQQYLERAVMFERKGSARREGSAVIDGKALWEQCKEALRVCCPDADGQRMIGLMEFESWNDGTLLIGIPSKEVFEWSEAHLADHLKDVIMKYFGSFRKLNYNLHEQHERCGILPNEEAGAPAASPGEDLSDADA